LERDADREAIHSAIKPVLAALETAESLTVIKQMKPAYRYDLTKSKLALLKILKALDDEIKEGTPEGRDLAAALYLKNSQGD
jgi:hypothetical protein